MKIIFLGVLGIAYCISLAYTGWTGDYVQLGKVCDPEQQNGGVANSKEWSGKVCFPGSKCNPKTKICDCADSSDGDWKRTFQKGECRLRPGSVCVPNVDQDYYRCVENSKCTKTREGVNVSMCPADAPCDTGDAYCLCEAGKTCLTEVVPAEPL